MRAVLSGLAARGAADYWPGAHQPAHIAAYAFLIIIFLGLGLTIAILVRRERAAAE